MSHALISERIARGFAVLALAACALAPATAAAAHYLWEVSSLTNKIYLFGTVHAGKQAWFPLPEPVEAALRDSQVLVVEADISNTAAMTKSASAMLYAPPDRLDKHVSPADYERFRKLLVKYSLPEPQIRQLKPFMAVSLLVFSEWGRLGYLPQFGIDGYLIRKAQAEARPIVEIEGAGVQVELITSLTREEMAQLFAGTLQALESGLTSEQITGMVNAWQSGDPDLLLEVARKYNSDVPGAKVLEEKFIWARHDVMAQKIEGYLNDQRERHFVAVGALHLAGPRGLVEMLRKRGYVVKQL